MSRFIDARATLPRHPTKKFTRRPVESILGGVIHHTAGGDDIENTAMYHVGPNHVSATGCPALLYTFYITGQGVIYWANDLEDVTWSQGGHGSPIPGTNPNANFLAICCAGDFSNTIGPQFAQIYSFITLWGHLAGTRKLSRYPDSLYNVLNCSVESLWGHHNFGKPACPGQFLSGLADTVRSHMSIWWGLETDADWQDALNGWGAFLVVDGIWGRLSKAALVEFQRDHDLVADGIRGPLTEAQLISYWNPDA